MSQLKLFVIAFFASLFLFSCNEETPKPANANLASNTTAANVQPTAAPDELAAVKKIYAERCSKCHKDNGEGGTQTIEDVTIKVPNFKSESLKKDPDSEFIKQIEDGGDGMPKFKGKITDQEIKDLVKLIRRDFQK